MTVIMIHLVAVTFIVTLSYFVMWTTSKPDRPKDVLLFGKIMSKILLITAGLVLINGMTYGPKTIRNISMKYSRSCSSCMETSDNLQNSLMGKMQVSSGQNVTVEKEQNK
ncbi:MAG: hypothetical protein WC955_11200 [Elusimicrobiota bacterium]